MTTYEYAKQEFEVLGWPGDDEIQQMICDNILELLKTFDEQGHSGFSANYLLNMFDRLARLKPISPLTGNDDEWVKINDNLWQNKRCCSVFKDETGAYWIEGRVFRTPDGSCYMTKDSRVPVEFPWTMPEPEIVEVEK